MHSIVKVMIDAFLRQKMKRMFAVLNEVRYCLGEASILLRNHSGKNCQQIVSRRGDDLLRNSVSENEKYFGRLIVISCGTI